ncbi:hypothetical protein F4818DRAFT_359294 [Hypoxylon cercidicola]|nr:hypothetical protein F4818DRAFT_359294 [Hypoxylon cercidicola]
MAVDAIAPGGIKVIITAAILLAFATVMIVLRFLARMRSQSLGIDDWASLTSYAFLVGVTTCHFLLFSSQGYGGAPLDDFTPEQLSHFLLMTYTDTILYICCTAAIKMSILLLFRRIFVTRAFGVITAVLAGVLIVWFLCVLFLQIFFCKPVSASWIPAETEHCLYKTRFYQAISISNILWDFTLLFLPLPMVWRLNTTNKRKLQLCGIFLVGIFICACSILRTTVLCDWRQNNRSDIVWQAGLWTVLECAIGVSCACMPPLLSLLKEWHLKALLVRQRCLASNGAMMLQLNS